MRGWHAPEHEVLALQSGPLHYRIAGEGPLVVLLHGANGSLRDWTHSHFDALATRHTVVAFDRPGLGASAPAADPSLSAQAAVMRAGLGVLADKGRIGAGKRPVILGHSFGGSVALAWALDAPDEVSGLVLLGAPSQEFPGSPGRVTDLINTPLLGYLLSFAAPYIGNEARQRAALDALFAPQAVPEGYFAHFAPSRSLKPAIFRRSAAQVGALKTQLRLMSSHYHRLAVPVELIHGTDDTTVPIHIHSAPTARALPNARLTRLAGIGHMPHHVVPEALEAALARLMDKGAHNHDTGAKL